MTILPGLLNGESEMQLLTKEICLFSPVRELQRRNRLGISHNTLALHKYLLGCYVVRGVGVGTSLIYTPIACTTEILKGEGEGGCVVVDESAGNGSE